MKQVTLQIPDNQYGFFMELVKKLKFVKVEEPKQKELTATQKEFVSDLKEALNEVERHERGEIELQNARDFLNEL